MMTNDLKIEMVTIDQIFPYWNNARNNKKTVKVVEQSIRKYGFNQPIAIDIKGEIIAGHSRFFAAQNIGMQEIPCVRLNLSEEQCRQYRIADNKSHEFTTWDDDKLIRELRVLADAFDMQDFFFEPIGELLGFDSAATQQHEYTPAQPERVNVASAPENTAEEDAENFRDKQEKIVDKLSHEPTKYKDITCPNCGEIIRMKE